MAGYLGRVSDFFPAHFGGPADFLAMPHIGTLARLIIKYPACLLLGKTLIFHGKPGPENILHRFNFQGMKFDWRFDRKCFRTRQKRGPLSVESPFGKFRFPQVSRVQE